ncbi:MAG: GNAT family protein [Agathobacter sp.]|nr:GNAT family protein [Agathobacter sp.]
MLFQYETPRLRLRITEPYDADMVLDFFMRDKELFERYEADRVPNFYTVEHQEKLLRAEYQLALHMQCIRFYITLKDDPSKIIGTMCLRNIQRPLYGSCEIGYKFSSAFHHKGYATEALRKVCEIAVKELGLHRINAWVHPQNTDSMKLLERNGFYEEGLCKEYLMLHGQWTDHIQYVYLNSFNQ